MSSKLEKPQVNTERQIITIEEPIDEPIGTLNEVVEYIQQLQEKYGKYKIVTLNYVPVTYEDYQYEVKYTRLETDDELNQRIQNEQMALEEWMQTKQNDQLKQQLLEQKQKLHEQLTELEQELKILD